MQEALEVGLICLIGDEQILVKNVNLFLKNADLGKLKRDLPTGIWNPEDRSQDPKFSHYYWSARTKQRPSWYFDLHPNVDEIGRARFPNRLDCGWTLFFNRLHLELNTSSEDHALQQFLMDLLTSVGYPAVSLHVYGPREFRR
jgi:hypothetical protein